MHIELGDVLIGSGLLLVAIGVSLWSVPAGIVVLGFELVGTGVLVFRASTPPVPPDPATDPTPGIAALDELGRRRAA